MITKFIFNILLSQWEKDRVTCECNNFKANGTIFKNQNGHFEFLTTKDNSRYIDSFILKSYKLKSWKHIYIDKLLSNSRYYPSNYESEKYEYQTRKDILEISLS